MRKEKVIRLFLSLMTAFILVVSVFASENTTYYNEMDKSDAERLEIIQPSQPQVTPQPDERFFEMEKETILTPTEHGNDHEDLKTLENNKVNEELIIEEETRIEESYELLSAAPPGGSSTYDYVIITTNDIVDNSEELEHFVNMKEIEGHSVKIVTETDFEGLTGQYPNDRADKIRKWLIDNYQTMGIEYVLFVGDPDPEDSRDPGDHVGDVPMKMCFTQSFTPFNPGIPTDLYFGDLDSNWDLDGDGIYCEFDSILNPRSPNGSIHEDTFSIFWIGEVMCNFSTNYTFWTYSDDAVKVMLDGEYIIDNWTPHTQTVDEATRFMNAGRHDLQIFYRDDYGDGIIRLYWRTEVDKNDPCFFKNQIIPSYNLYDEGGIIGGLTGYYYDNPDFTDHKITRKDPEVAFFWGSGDKGLNDPDHHTEVIVGRIPVYDDDYGHLEKIFRKIIDYETDPGDISWRKSLLLPMVPMDSKTPSWGLGEALKDNVAIPSGFSYYRIYDEDYASSGGPTPEIWPCYYDNTYNEWKKGYGMVTWHTHGNEIKGTRVMHLDNISHLDDSKPSFTFQASCLNSCPERKDNLAYSLLKHGGIATVSSTRVSTYTGGHYTSFYPQHVINHDMAYFYTGYVIYYGINAGSALKVVKSAHDPIGANTLRYVLYGDPDCYLLITNPNEPPVVDINGPYTGYEGSSITFDASGSYDPEGDILDYRWDFDDDGIWDTEWSASPTVNYTWGDDYTGDVKVEVRDQLGKTGNDTTTVNVYNLAPAIEDVKAYILVDFTLRAAGEKYHNVEMLILEDGSQIGYAEVVRYPGSPDDQSKTLVDVKCNVTKVISVKVLYTPLNDKVNGQPNGATPCWVNVSFEDGGYNRSHHTFNVKHPNTWEWIIGVNKFFLNHEMTFEADASDVGSDDLTFTWDWDDGTSDTVTTYYNDVANPDPFPSPEGTYPFLAMDVAKHTFTVSGSYNVVLTVSDDDGGASGVVLTISLI
ncbi:MAG: PKD domain-containing protein [Thermoplasmata archaeon]|nr:MAG: PKD domain-containing protein [Thermoplasmata archaeon]